MAGNWQTARNSRWASLPSMAAMSGFCRSHSSTVLGPAQADGWPDGSDTRSREGRSSTAGVQLPSGVQKMVGVLHG